MKNEQGMSVLICSHLLRDIEQVCDEAVIMKDGAIVHQCNLEERAAIEQTVRRARGDGRRSEPARGAAGDRRRRLPKAAAAGGIVPALGVEFEAVWALAARQNLLVRKLTHRRDTLEEIFLKAMGHLAHTPENLVKS